MAMRRVCAVFGALVLAVAAGQAPRAAADPAISTDAGTFTFVLENDVTGGTDENYTNGFILGYTSGPRSGGALRGLAKVLPFMDDDAELRYSVAIGQSMFTPSDTESIPPDPDDRPYAGWLYGAFGIIAEKGRSLTSYELNLGVVGPSALGEEVQDGFHSIINGEHYEGWDYQLEDEFGYMLIVDRKWSPVADLDVNGLEVDVIPHVTAAAGNVMTYAGLGATFRLGTELNLDYGPPRVRPSLGGARYVKAQDGFRWYLFAGAEGRAVAQNIFLDGTSHANSPTVDKYPLTYDIQAGLALQFGDCTFAYTNVYRSKEFEGQDDGDRFGALSLSFTF